MPTATILNSWKEIAHYIGRGVRTVQRWERELGLPVRRPKGKSRSAVIAVTADIDNWLKARPTAHENGNHVHNPKLHEQMHTNQERAAQLRELAEQVHKRVLALYGAVASVCNRREKRR